MQDRKRHDGQDKFSEMLINYLAVTNLSVGLLVNFGERKLEYRRAHHAPCDYVNPVLF